ncbi:LOW QUALITY PROTEIN: hypothetical protein HID58_002511, partial [Brassica napus]
DVFDVGVISFRKFDGSCKTRSHETGETVQLGNSRIDMFKPEMLFARQESPEFMDFKRTNAYEPPRVRVLATLLAIWICEAIPKKRKRRGRLPYTPLSLTASCSAYSDVTFFPPLWCGSRARKGLVLLLAGLMNRLAGSCSNGDTYRPVRRQKQGEEDEIIRVPAFDNSDLIEKFKLPLVGRILRLTALGVYDKADVDGSRVHVFINRDNPLKFECKVGFNNGDVVKVTIKYEDLHHHCFTCKRISHEEGTCPELNEEQRECNRVLRIEQKELEERATWEAFSLPQRQSLQDPGKKSYNRDTGVMEPRKDIHRSSSSRREWSNDKDYSRDLHGKIQERRYYHSKNVWNRLDNPNTSEFPQNQERYHPYQHSSHVGYKERTRDTASSSEWRIKDPNKKRQEHKAGILGTNQNKEMAREDHLQTHSEPSLITIDARLIVPTTRVATLAPLPPKIWNGDQLSKTEKERRRSKICSFEREGYPGLLILKRVIPPTQAREDSSELQRGSKNHEGSLGQKPPKELGGERTDLIKEKSMEKETNMASPTASEVDKEENELNKSIDEYADLSMDADMVEDDDLLDENFETVENFESPDNENTEEAEKEDGSSLPEYPEEQRVIKAELMYGKTHKAGIKDRKEKNEASYAMSLGKKRGSRSPDLRGAAASRKLANRGR